MITTTAASGNSSWRNGIDSRLNGVFSHHVRLPADQETALPPQGVHVGMLAEHADQLAGTAPPGTSDKVRSSHRPSLARAPTGWQAISAAARPAPPAASEQRGCA